VQTGLQRLARPWYRVRALRVFRDDTGLAVNPHLWSSITAAMAESSYFVLMASPEAAASPWVNREIEHWDISIDSWVSRACAIANRNLTPAEWT
jgi:hypothetical protein